MITDVRNRYAERSWDVFNSYLEKTPPLNGIFLLLSSHTDVVLSSIIFDLVYFG